jgi:hypothetical protein
VRTVLAAAAVSILFCALNITIPTGILSSEHLITNLSTHACWHEPEGSWTPIEYLATSCF